MVVMVMKYKQLNEVFTDWLTNGIFSTFQNLESISVPWKNEDIDFSLDMIYHGNISGEKLCSPLVYKFVQGEVATDDERKALATAIFNLFNKNWNKEWETMLLEYNPIENYRMVEDLENDITEIEYGKMQTRTDDLTHTKTGTETNNPDLETENIPDLTNVTNNSVYGFNSDNPVPTGKQQQTSTGNTKQSTTGTDEIEYDTEDNDTGTQTYEDSGTDTHTRNYELTRKGNIGVTTSQQMIQSERELWIWNYFVNVVFPDIDRVLTLKIY